MLLDTIWRPGAAVGIPTTEPDGESIDQRMCKLHNDPGGVAPPRIQRGGGVFSRQTLPAHLGLGILYLELPVPWLRTSP